MIASLLHRWFRAPFAGSPMQSHAPIARHGARASYKLRVEELEQRVVPAWVVKDLTTLTPAALTSNLTSGSKDIIANVVYTGAPGAAGTFTDTASTIGFSSGIILSSGAAKSLPGPNNSPSTTTSNGTASDPSLDAIIAPTPGFDASVLTFNYTPKGAFVLFTFAFGSEEYPEFAPPNITPFNDVFAFFVNGTNAALLPGTATPVSIANVNLVTNANDYVDNFTNAAGPIYGTHNTQMDGYTKVLTVSLPVVPNQKNVIKLAVEDAGDSLYDTFVMIKTGSLASYALPTYGPLRFTYHPLTKQYSGDFTVVNNNSISIISPIYMLFQSLPPGVKVVNATGTSPSGYKYIFMGNNLKSGGSLKATVYFTDPLNVNLGTYFLHPPIIVTGILF